MNIFLPFVPNILVFYHRQVLRIHWNSMQTAYAPERTLGRCNWVVQYIMNNVQFAWKAGELLVNRNHYKLVRNEDESEFLFLLLWAFMVLCNFQSGCWQWIGKHWEGAGGQGGGSISEKLQSDAHQLEWEEAPGTQKSYAGAIQKESKRWEDQGAGLHGHAMICSSEGAY